jgi:hypothetical protein
VRVVGLTMASGNTTTGRVSYAPVGNTAGGSLRVWISTSADGSRVSSGCSKVGSAEGSLRIGGSGCQLSAGRKYYLNLALCTSSSSDLYCKSSGAKTSRGDATIKVFSKYD